MTRLLPLAALLLGSPAYGALPASVLLLGDSHTVGSYGQELEKLLEGAGARVKTYAVCGASARWWAATPHPPQPCSGYALHPARGGRYSSAPPALAELSADRPALIVVGLGSNQDGRTLDDFVAAAKALLAALPAESKVLWVGPPPMPARLSYISQVYAAFPAVGIAPLDSRKWLSSSEATSDHFNGAPGRAWAAHVFAELSK